MLSNLRCRHKALLPLGTHPIYRCFGYVLGENPLTDVKPVSRAASGSASVSRKRTMGYF